MSFMERQITRKLEWYAIETNQGLWFVAVEDVGAYITLENAVENLTEFCEGQIKSVSLKTGYGARLSAPGYMDCTEWAVFDTAEEAEQYLDENYPEDDEEEEEAE